MQRAAIRTGVFLLLYLVGLVLLSPLAGWVGGYLVGVTVGGLLASAFATYFAMRIFGERPFVQVGLGWNGRNALIGLGGGAGAALLVLGPAVLLGAAEFTRSADSSGNWRAMLFAPVLIFCGALGEELLFHGFGFQTLLRHFGTFSTVLPVGVLFGLLHASNPNSSPLGLINTAGFGILFGLAYLRTHDLWLPVGLHFGWNIMLPVFGADLSGITINPAGLSLTWNVGPLWSGGKYGPEASLLTSAVLFLLAVYIWRMPVRRAHSAIVDGPELS